MITLYIDTHSETIVLALYQNEKLIQKRIEDSNEHSKTFMPMLIGFLENNNTKIEDLSDIVVVNGPGSFTGIRIGITTAKTIAFCKKITIRTITSLERFLTNKIEEDYIVMEEKNGYYIGKIDHDDNEIKEYFYLKNSEYQEFTKQNKILKPLEVDYDKLIKYAHQKPIKNPHQVNPTYIKKIEVEK